MNSITAKEEAIITSGDAEEKLAAEPRTNYSVGRIKQDFNEGSTVIGGIFTSTIRNIKDEHLEFLLNHAEVIVSDEARGEILERLLDKAL